MLDFAARLVGRGGASSEAGAVNIDKVSECPPNNKGRASCNGRLNVMM